MTRPLLAVIASLAAAVLLPSCGGSCRKDRAHAMVVSLKDQEMLLVRNGKPVKSYKVSTSKFGVGDRPNSNHTPLGKLKVAKKIGDSAPLGSVFKSRRRTGEVIKPNAPGRDPIVSRILWLTGTETRNRNAFRRCIYIHGTPQESHLGKPASYGCIRMSSKDVADLYKRVGPGASVYVIRGPLSSPTGSASGSLAKNR